MEGVHLLRETLCRNAVTIKGVCRVTRNLRRERADVERRVRPVVHHQPIQPLPRGNHTHTYKRKPSSLSPQGLTPYQPGASSQTSTLSVDAKSHLFITSRSMG
jgi:hypothetical protein